MTWTQIPLLGFDTETTGVEETAHILSATIVYAQPGHPPEPYTLYLNHRVPINNGHIHGLTQEFIEANGVEPDAALEEICVLVAAELEIGRPLVGMNLEFDLTRLDRNCRRYGVTPLSDRVKLQPVIDAYVLDKGVDRYRKGGRRLVDLAAIYRVPWDPEAAHTSEADALAALRVAWRIGRMYPALGALPLAKLHALQAIWKRQQDVSLAAYKKRNNQPYDGLTGEWPVRLPAREPEMGLFS